MSNVSQWETSAPNNNAAPPDGAPEGMAANTVNDTMREMMAAVARWYQDTNGSLVTGGAGNAYTLSTNNNNSSLTDLPLVVFVANRENTGAATLNVDGLGAKSLRFNGAALPSGAIQADTAYIAIYNAEDDAFDLVGVPTRDASAITTGELPDGRLSDNVPLKDTRNVFTAGFSTAAGGAIVLRANGPGISFVDTGADENEANYSLRAVGGVFRLQFSGDANVGGNTTTPLSIARTGTVVDEIELNATALDFNGNADISGTLTMGGAVLLPQGSASAPSVARGNDPDTGLYFPAGNTVGLSAGGSLVASFSQSEIDLTATTLDFNGNADISGTLSVGGAVRAGTAATSTSATLAAGQIHHRSADTTVPSMNAGQWVAVQNTSTSSITLSQGAGVTLELGGTTITGNRTLLAKGFAFIYFRANGVGVVHGSGVV